MTLLPLFQLISPSFPVGAYSYSEGLETLVEKGIIKDHLTLKQWLINELNYGSIRLETIVMIRGYQAFHEQNFDKINHWNQWLSATRETQELRQQSWQMGQSLWRLLPELNPEFLSICQKIHLPCNYTIALSLAFATWKIEISEAVIGYLWSWVNNLVSAGIRLIPLGQTTGQKLLLDLHPLILNVTDNLLNLSDDDLYSCSWGLALASMNHEVQYTRLFRS